MGRRSLWCLSAALAVLVAAACSSRTTSGGEDGATGDGDDGTSGDGGPGDDGDPGDDGEPDDDGDPTAPPPLGPREVDILFVIDNSGSMGEEQGALVAGLGSLISPLDDAGVGYRIGITTTDNGNPWCSGTTPEGGALRISSCKSRLEEFIFPGTDPPTDKQAEGCTDLCKLDSFDILPTSTDADPTPKPHPWIERIDGASNVGGGAEPIDALACALPQGINGCGFESHLESMYKALRRFEDNNEGSYGFLRPEAHLMIVFVSDEVDCSYAVAHDSIFLPDGDRTFWSDPDSAYPTSAVCWGAGVTCTGGPGTYDACHSQNKDTQGNPTGDGDAVIRPVSRYTSLLEGVQEQKLATSGASVMVAAIAGVPSDYPSGADIVYQDTQDTTFQGDYGIGPGCQSANGVAIPPVRVLEVTEALAAGDERNLYSVCDSSYVPAVAAIADAILARVQ